METINTLPNLTVILAPYAIVVTLYLLAVILWAKKGD